MTLRRAILIVVNLTFGFMLTVLWSWPDDDTTISAATSETFAWADLISRSDSSASSVITEPTAQDEERTPHDFRVMGIVINGEHRVAIVLAKGENGPQRVSEGDRIQGRKVIFIRPRSIEIDEEGTRSEFPLDPPRSAP